MARKQRYNSDVGEGPLERVIAAEDEAGRALEAARSQARARIEAARELARRIERRADERIAKIHAECERRLRRRLAEMVDRDKAGAAREYGRGQLNDTVQRAALELIGIDREEESG